MQSYQERVERGAALLDTLHGPGWREKVDRERLDLACARKCVLGQVYGNFHTAFAYLGSEPMSACIDYGFYDNEDFALLTETWAEFLSNDSDLALAGD